MILDGKGRGLSGCGLHEWSYFQSFFNRSIQYSCLFLDKRFACLTMDHLLKSMLATIDGADSKGDLPI